MHAAIALLFWLLVAHSLCDFPLQGEFLSAAKRSGLMPLHWSLALTWHSMIHAGAVALLTGSIAIGIYELVAHWSIDFFKVNGAFDGGPPIPYELKPNQDWKPTPAQRQRAFTIDQLLHVVCKLAWMVLA